MASGLGAIILVLILVKQDVDRNSPEAELLQADLARLEQQHGGLKKSASDLNQNALDEITEIAKVQAKIVKVRDLVITHLMSKKFSEIRTPQGKYKLKEDLVWHMNRAVGGKPIITLYFTDFVSQ